MLLVVVVTAWAPWQHVFGQISPRKQPTANGCCKKQIPPHAVPVNHKQRKCIIFATSRREELKRPEKTYLRASLKCANRQPRRIKRKCGLDRCMRRWAAEEAKKALKNGADAELQNPAKKDRGTPLWKRVCR